MDIKRAKQEIEDTVKAYLAKDPLGEYAIPAIRQRPILLMGPPGIGKTQVMEQVARECGVARPHQQDGALPDGRDGVFAQGVLGKVGFYGVFDLFFGTFDVHNRCSPLYQELFRSRYRSSSSARASARALAGRAAAPVNSSSSRTTFMAHGGTLASSNRSPKNRKAVS